MSERFPQDEWPGPGDTPESKCGVWNTVAILAGALGLGVALGVIGYLVWRWIG